MKITSLNQVLDLYKQKNTNKQPVENNSKKYDEVSISNEAYEKLNTKNLSFEEQLKSIDMGKLIDEVSEVDHDKVAKLKSQIASGNYKIDAYKIADSLINDDSLI
jgi:flagellar biosynthesis anti-sigma factor FlgM